MILDKGIATIYRKENAAPPGGKPTFENVELFRSWYGELSFATSEARPTERREEVRTDARVRILQCRSINNHDRVTLSPFGGEDAYFEVIRAYHGRDDESGELISDLSLAVIEP